MMENPMSTVFELLLNKLFPNDIPKTLFYI